MKPQVFQRTEYKYLLNPEQYEEILPLIEAHLEKDRFSRSTIQSLYYDTESRLLIRRSIEKPKYKEKLRLRSYGLVKPEDLVFLEIKKKYRGIVYKRRIELSEKEAVSYLNRRSPRPDSQIGKEIDWVLNYYENLSPSMLIVYDRAAYAEKGGGLRITFDSHIRFREDHLSLTYGLDGENLFAEEKILMEVKADSAIPLYLVRFLSEKRIFKTSFSKYGTAYAKTETKKKEEPAWKNYSTPSLQNQR